MLSKGSLQYEVRKTTGSIMLHATGQPDLYSFTQRPASLLWSNEPSIGKQSRICSGKGIAVSVKATRATREAMCVPRQTRHQGRQLRPVPSRVVVELKQRDGHKLHVLGHSEYLCITKTTSPWASEMYVACERTYCVPAYVRGRAFCIPLAW